MIKASNLLSEGHFRFQNLEEAQALTEFLAEICPNKSLAHMGISELFCNAVEHGNLGISAEEKAALQKNGLWLSEINHRLALPENINKWVEVFVTRLPTELHIKVVDQGRGFDWHPYQTNNKNINLDTHGRGIIMARDLVFNKLEFSGLGNVVTGIIHLP